MSKVYATLKYNLWNGEFTTKNFSDFKVFDSVEDAADWLFKESGAPRSKWKVKQGNFDLSIVMDREPTEEDVAPFSLDEVNIRVRQVDLNPPKIGTRRDPSAPRNFRTEYCIEFKDDLPIYILRDF